LAKVDFLKAENDKLKSEVELLKLMNDKIVKLEQKVNNLTAMKQSSLSKTIELKTISSKGDTK
jgi:hypothetical protein